MHACCGDCNFHGGHHGHGHHHHDDSHANYQKGPSPAP